MLMRLRLVALTYPKSTRHVNISEIVETYSLSFQLANLLFDIQERRKNDNIIDCRAQTLYSLQHTQLLFLMIVTRRMDAFWWCIYMQSEKLEFSASCDFTLIRLTFIYFNGYLMHSRAYMSDYKLTCLSMVDRFRIL